MQSVFKGIFKTISNYENEINSSPLQFAGALALGNSPTRFRLPVGFASVEGIYTAIETTGGITWNGVTLSPGSVLTGKLSIDPPSGFAVVKEPYLDNTGTKVKVGLRKADESEGRHVITFDSTLVNAGQTNEGTVINVFDDSTDLQSRTMYYSASALGNFDFSDQVATGSFTMVNGVGTFSKTISNDTFTDNDELLQFTISNDSSFKKIVGTTQVITVKDISKSPIVTVTSNAVNEGEKITITVSFVSSSIGAFDANYYYVLDSTSGTVNSGDFTDGLMQGSFAVNSTTKIGTIEKTLKRDLLTEGPETFNVYIKQASTSGNTIATVGISVVDSSTGTGAFTTAIACSPSPATEGQLLTITVSDPDQQFDGSFYYFISGTNGFDRYDLQDNLNSGQILFNGTSSTFYKTLKNDYLSESNESLTIKIGKNLKQYFSVGVTDKDLDGWNGATGSLFINDIYNSSFDLVNSGAGPNFRNFEVSTDDDLKLILPGGQYSEGMVRVYTGQNGAGQNIYYSNVLTSGSTITALLKASASYFDRAHDVGFSSAFPAGITAPSTTVNIVDNSISFSNFNCTISPDSASFDEGTSFTFNLTSSGGYTGNIRYQLNSVSGSITSNDFLSPTFATILTGTVSMISGAATLPVTIKNDMSPIENEEVFYATFQTIGSVSINVSSVEGLSSPSTYGPTVEIYDGSILPENLLTTIVATTNFNQNYNITGITQDRIVTRVTSIAPKIQMKIYSGLDGTGEILNTISAAVADATNNATVIPRNEFGITFSSRNIAINDTSTVVPAILNVSALTSSEGQTLQFTVDDASNFYNGTAYYIMTGSNFDLFDLNPGNDRTVSGLLTFVNGQAVITKSLARDYTNENETIEIKIAPSIKQYFSVGIEDKYADAWDDGYGTVTVSGANGTVAIGLSMTDVFGGPKYYNFEVSPNDTISYNLFGGSYAETTVRFFNQRDGTGTKILDTGMLTGNIFLTGSLTASNSWFTNAHAVALGGMPNEAFYLSASVKIDDVLGTSEVIINPTYTSYDEGTNITLNITCSDSWNDNGAQIYYKINQVSGIINANDFNSLSLTGYLSLTNGIGSLVLPLKNDTTVSEGQEEFNVSFELFPSIKVVPVPGVTASPLGPGSVGPTFNVYDGNTSSYTRTITSTVGSTYNLDSTNITQNNLIIVVTGDARKAQIEIYSGPNGTGRLLNTIPGQAFLPMQYYSTIVPINTYKSFLSNNVIVNDTSTFTYVPALLTINNATASEGSTISFTVSDPGNLYNGTAYYLFTGSNGFDRFDLDNNNSSGLITFNSGSATITRTFLKDMIAENESFTLKVAPSLIQNFSIRMSDSYGDGWNGGNGTIMVNGVSIGTFSMTEATVGPKFYNFNASPGDNVQLILNGGTYLESRVKVYTGYNGTGNLIYDSGVLAASTTIQPTFVLSSSFFTRAHDVASGSNTVAEFLETTMNLGDLASGITVTPNQVSYNEGTSITFDVSMSETYTGNLPYMISQVSGTISSTDFTNFSSSIMTGSVTMVSGSGSLNLTIANDMSATGSEGSETFGISFISAPMISPGPVADNSTIFAPGTSGPRFDIYDGALNRWIMAVSSSFASGTRVTGLTQNNMIVKVTSATAKSQLNITAGGTGELIDQINSAFVTESSTIVPYNQFGTLTQAITINDTSFVNTPVITVSPTTYNEGSPISVQVSNLTNGTYYYTIDGTSITAADFTTAFNGSFSVTDGTGLFNISLTLSNDVTSEGVESFTVRIRAGSTSGTIIASSSPITVNDTSSGGTIVAFPINTTVTASGTNQSLLYTTSIVSRAQEVVYTAAELRAAGAYTGCLITGMQFYLTNAMRQLTFGPFAIGMQHTTQGATMTASVTSGYTVVYEKTASSWTPNIGEYINFQEPLFLFSNSVNYGRTGQPFTWNGVDNLLIKVAFGYNSSTSTSTNNGTTRYYASNGNTRYTTAANSLGGVGGRRTLASATTSTSTGRPRIGLWIS